MSSLEKVKLSIFVSKVYFLYDDAYHLATTPQYTCSVH